MKENGKLLFRNGCQSCETKAQIKLLLVDDHRALLDLLKFYLSATPEFEVVATAVDGLSAVAEARRTRPDVVIMDVNLPKVPGIQATKLLLKVHPRAAVIGLSAYHDQQTVLGMIRAGAKGFVPKSVASEQLISAIKEVANGGMYFSQKISKLARRTGQATGQHCEANPCLMTDQQRQVLSFVAQGLSNKEIAENLQIAIRTVEKHREMLVRKLHISGVAALTKFAIRIGLASLD